MNTPESDIERSLNDAVPLPCSIDSMQLMFDAGIEEQKRKTKKSRRMFVASTSLSCVLLVATLTLGFWNYRLVSENSNLIAALDSTPSGQGKQQELRSANDREKNRPDAPKQDGTAEQSDQSQTTAEDEEYKSPSRRSRQESLLYTFGRDLTRNDLAVQQFMLRGVALRPGDEFRNPTHSSNGSFVTSNGDSQSTGSSNMNSRQQMRFDLMGL